MLEANSGQSTEFSTKPDGTDFVAPPKGKHAERVVLFFRLFVGLLWGMGFYVLDKGFVDVDTQYVTIIRLIIMFAPLPLIFGVGNIPPKKLLLWFLITVIGLIIVGFFHSAPAWQGMDGL